MRDECFRLLSPLIHRNYFARDFRLVILPNVTTVAELIDPIGIGLQRRRRLNMIGWSVSVLDRCMKFENEIL